MGEFYTEALKDVKGIRLPIQKTDYADNIYWVYGIVLEEDIRADNRVVQNLLKEEAIGSRTFFWCMHEQPVYYKKGMFVDESYPNAEYLARKGFYIPSGLALTKHQMEYVIAGVIKVMDKLTKTGAYW